MRDTAEGDIELAQDLLDKLSDKIVELEFTSADRDGIEAIDIFTLCASLEVISKIALLICSILQPAERE